MNTSIFFCFEHASHHTLLCLLSGTHETVQELRAALEQEAEVSAQAFERVQAAEAELAELRADFIAVQVQPGTKTSLFSSCRRLEPLLTFLPSYCAFTRSSTIAVTKIMPSCSVLLL